MSFGFCLALFAAGGAGCLLRYLIGQWIGRPYWGTLVANLLGCLLLGLFNAAARRLSLGEECRIALTAGLCGGLTTMSSFCNETLSLARGGNIAPAALYLLFTIACGTALIALAAAWCKD